jgi:replicative DNA helicase
MMELALLRTLLDKEFYEDHKGIRCPEYIFTKDALKIKQTLDYAMQTYDKSLTPTELEALFFVNNGSMTTANKTAFKDLFNKLSRETPLNQDVARDVFSQLFRQGFGTKLANLAFDYVNGTETSLEPLRVMLSGHQDDFTPNMNIEWDDMSIEKLLEANNIQSRWKFNIPSLARRVEGISGGHLVVVGARPNTGKTSFHASLIAGPNGFAHQGAKCVILCNEEGTERVGARYLSAATSMSVDEVKVNMAAAALRYQPVRDNIYVKDSTSKNMAWVEAVVKAYQPDIVVLDMGDKFASKTSDKSDVYLKEAAIHARNIAKQYGCAVIWMSQLSAEAEGKVYVDQSMLEGSKTGKAAEADLMILISKNKLVEGQDEQDSERHLNIAKNKLKDGWHGVVHCQLNGERSQYSA